LSKVQNVSYRQSVQGTNREGQEETEGRGIMDIIVCAYISWTFNIIIVELLRLYLTLQES
jgi:hypothetical protein